MTPKLPDELRKALRQANGTLEVQDEETHRLYVLIDSDMFRRGMEALRAQEDSAAIQAGVEAMESGKGVSLDTLDERIRSGLAAS